MTEAEKKFLEIRAAMLMCGVEVTDVSQWHITLLALGRNELWIPRDDGESLYMCVGFGMLNEPTVKRRVDKVPTNDIIRKLAKQLGVISDT